LLAAIASIGIHADSIETLLARLTDLEKTDFAPPPLLTGDDLTAAGMQPGPRFKRVLDFVYDQQLEGRITSKQDALSLGLKRLTEG